MSLAPYLAGSNLTNRGWAASILANSTQPGGGGGGDPPSSPSQCTSKVFTCIPSKSSQVNKVPSPGFYANLVDQSIYMKAGIADLESSLYVTPQSRGCKVITSDHGFVYTIGPGQIVPGIGEWINVEPSDLPAVDAGVVMDAGISSNEMPTNHVSHDFRFDVMTDEPEYAWLISGGNLGVGDQDVRPDLASSPLAGRHVVEMEWESAFFNDGNYWPVEGDRVWAMGRWVYDCGHILNGHPFKTEIHPPQALAVSRFEPVIFPGHTAPSDAVKTYIYINGKGGYYTVKTGGRDYAFDIALPPQVEAGSTVKTQVLSYSGGPSPILTPMDIKPFVPGQVYQLPPRVHVVVPLSSIPASENNIFRAVVVAGWERHFGNHNPKSAAASLSQPTPHYRELQVTLDNITILKCTPGHCGLPVYTCLAPAGGGRCQPAVTFVPGCTNNDNLDWRVVIASVNGHYKPLSGFGKDSGLFDVCYGQTVNLNIPFPPVIVKDNAVPGGPLNFNTQFYDAGGSLKIRTSGYEREHIEFLFGSPPTDYNGLRELLAKPNQDICLPSATHTLADNFGVGVGVVKEQSTSNCGDSTLRYHVTELRPFTSDSFTLSRSAALGSTSAPPTSPNPIVLSGQRLSSPAQTTTMPNQSQSPTAGPPSSSPPISNLGPIARNESDVHTNATKPVSITLQATDPDPNAKLQAQIVSQPQHGKLGNIDQATGKITYTPNPNYSGPDSFTFKVNDGKSDSNTATVTIAVVSRSNLTNMPLIFSPNENSTSGNLTTSNPANHSTLSNTTKSNQSNASPQSTTTTMPNQSQSPTAGQAPSSQSSSNPAAPSTSPNENSTLASKIGNKTTLGNNTTSKPANNSTLNNATISKIEKALNGFPD